MEGGGGSGDEQAHEQNDVVETSPLPRKCQPICSTPKAAPSVVRETGEECRRIEKVFLTRQASHTLAELTLARASRTFPRRWCLDERCNRCAFGVWPSG